MKIYILLSIVSIMVSAVASITSIHLEAQAVWKLQTGQPFPTAIGGNQGSAPGGVSKSAPGGASGSATVGVSGSAPGGAPKSSPGGAPGSAPERSPRVNGMDSETITPASASQFNEFITTYHKRYSTEIEKNLRFRNFQVNQIVAEAFQTTEKGTAQYGVTKFSDMSFKEFKQFYRNLAISQMSSPTNLATVARGTFPSAVDWRRKGVVTAVKNQGQCGSCWAFSTTGNIESHWAIKKGRLYSLSEQQILDCDSTCFGCGGGWPTAAFDYVNKTGGLELEADYPYKTVQGQCRSNPSQFKVYVNGSVQISQNEDDMAKWCAVHGPISVLVNAGTMQYYKGGIAYQDTKQCPPAGLDHAILIVGYGLRENEPYWVVKNSWGPDWGEQGYWMVYRGYDVCGISSTPSSAVIH